MTKLTSEHWKFIYDIITIQLFKKQQVFFPMFVEYIKFLYLQNKPIDNSVGTLLKEQPTNLSNFEYKNEKFQKAMLQVYIKLLPEVYDEKDILTFQVALSVIKWNQKHPKEKICISSQKEILSTIKN
ncbi:hypothetical protein HHI36_009444 [Cryptolaemus montrouzieri]|uniref:Uncharacterized protein n=1 Tax=Cryptolaemus montrouzieri TaxID=559131 RepID=A0ABD2MFN3_9CUCU